MKRWIAGLTLPERRAIAGAAAAAALAAAELLWPHPLEVFVAPSGTEVVAAAPQTDVWQPDALAAYQPIADRPLFTSDRKPYVPPPPEVSAPAQPQSPRVEFQLTAIITSGDARIALLKTNLSPGVRKVAIDQTIEGWTLVEVRDSEVTLRSGADVRTVALQPQRTKEHVQRSSVDTVARGQ